MVGFCIIIEMDPGIGSKFGASNYLQLHPELWSRLVVVSKVRVGEIATKTMTGSRTCNVCSRDPNEHTPILVHRP